MQAHETAVSALVVLVAATETDGLAVVIDPGTEVFAGWPDSPAGIAALAPTLVDLGITRQAAIPAVEIRGAGARPADAPFRTRVAGSANAVGLGKDGKQIRVTLRRHHISDAVLIGSAGSRAQDADAAHGIAGLVGAVADGPPVDAAIGLQPIAALESPDLERKRGRGQRVGRVEVADAARGVSGAVGVCHALLAEVLVARNARAEIAAGSLGVVGGKSPIVAVGVGRALEAVADVAAEIAGVGPRSAHPARGAAIAGGSGIRRAGDLAENVAPIDEWTSSAGAPRAASGGPGAGRTGARCCASASCRDASTRGG